METEIKDAKNADSKMPQEDIAELLKQKRGGFVIRSFNWWGPLQLRAWALVAMLKGYFSFSEFCQLSLPSFFSDKSKLMDRFGAFFYEELKKEYPAHANCLNLFGHAFEGNNSYEVILLINEIIILDQYHAEQFFKKDFIVIDAGANSGVFSVFAAHLAPQGRIYSFEPVANTFENLKKNTRDYPGITCINSGLGDEISQKNIFVNSRSTLGSVFEDSPFYRTRSDWKEHESASIMTIDAFVAENNIPRIDFIKIDTEGYEAKILNGAKESIRKWKPVIAMSAYHNPNDKEDLPRIVKKIYPHYICELHREHEEDFICYVKK